MLYAEAFVIAKPDGSYVRNAHTQEMVAFLDKGDAERAAGQGNKVEGFRLSLASGGEDVMVDIRQAVAEAACGEAMTVAGLCEEASGTATSKGFGQQSVGDFVSLCHTELSEAYEEWRAGKEVDQVYFSRSKDSDAPKPEGFLAELADVKIRIAHFVGERGLTKEFVSVIRAKLDFNKTRSHKHGGKRI